MVDGTNGTGGTGGEPETSDSLRTFGAVVHALREHKGISLHGLPQRHDLDLDVPLPADQLQQVIQQFPGDLLTARVPFEHRLGPLDEVLVGHSAALLERMRGAL